MGRFITIVIVLIAAALLINYLMSRENAPEEIMDEAPPFVAEPAVEKPAEAPEKDASDSAKTDSEHSEPEETSQPEEEKSTKPKPDESNKEATTEESAKESTEKESTEEKAIKKDSSEPETKPAEPAPDESAAVKTAKHDPEESAAEAEGSGQVEFIYTYYEIPSIGDPNLTAGIPGDGELTLEQIEAWLADEKNHEPITPKLPLGLAAGAGEIKGIDENPLTKAKIELGRQLYFDTRLSADSTISCASCHDPDNGYAKDTQFGVGMGGQTGERNSPVAFNRIFSAAQFWDGRAESLEAQAIGPIANPIEMGNTHEASVNTIKGVAGYQEQFDAVFDDGLTIENIGKAIASFERAIVTGPAPWDYYQELATFEKAYAADIEDLEALQEEDEELYNDYMSRKQASEAYPISESAIRGGELFFSDKAGCTACHVGVNFTDEKYHNLGVGMEAEEPDLGRFVVTNEEKDRGAFKTPTVRNISLTGPYMHDGSQKTLMEVVEWYAKGGHPNEHLSKDIKKLDLSDQDKQDLVAFMSEGLRSSFPKVEKGRLPQ